MPTHPNWTALLLLCLTIFEHVCLGASSKVAWLVPQGGGQVAAPEGAATFSSMESFLQPAYLAVFDTIVLTCDYSMSAEEWGARKTQLERSLTFESATGHVFVLGFDFIKSGLVVPTGVTVTLRNLAIDRVRKISGWALPFFTGDGGILWLENVVRMRLVCLPVANNTVSSLDESPRPDRFPGQQQVALIDYYFRGTVYPGSVHDEDLVMFLEPGDVDDSAAYSGYTMVQLNVTRTCLAYTPRDCQEQPDICLERAVELALSAKAGRGQPDVRWQVAVAVPVVVGAGLLASAAALYFSRRFRRQKLLKQQQKQQNHFFKQQPTEGQRLLQQQHQKGQQKTGTSCAHITMIGGSKDGSSSRQHSGCDGLAAPEQMHTGVCSGAVGTIEDVATGGVACAAGKSNAWRLMACHTAPDFKDATPKDNITLGVLLGVGSFGRVYRGMWRGMDVAVKVLHHGTSTAAAVANEVDLIMSFRHPNITTAYHFVTWNYEAKDTGSASRKAPTAAAAAGGVGADGGGCSTHSQPGSSASTEDTARRVLPDGGFGRHSVGASTAGYTHTYSTNAQSASSEAAAGAAAAAAAEEVAGGAAGLPPSPYDSHSAWAVNPGGAKPAHDTTIDASHVIIPVGAMTHGMTNHLGGISHGMTHPAVGSGDAKGSMKHSSSNHNTALDAGVSCSSTSNSGGPIVPLDVVLVPSTAAAAAAAGVKDLDTGVPAEVAAASRKSTGRCWSDSQAYLAAANTQHTEQTQVPAQQLFVLLSPLRLPEKRQPQWNDHKQRQQQQQYIPVAPNYSPIQLPAYSCSAPPAQRQQQQQQGLPQPPTVTSAVAGSCTSSRALMGHSQGEAQTWLLMEFCDGGTLLDVLQEGQLLSKATGQVNLAHVLTLLCDVAAGMSYLHRRNVLHGDLKPGNVLLKRQQGASFGHVCKVTDFGMSRSLNAGQSHRSTRTMGTVNHTSPELLRMGRLSAACDVFAFGIMMWELFTGQVAWAGQHYGQVFERVALLQERPAVPPAMPAEYAQLMTAAWAADPFQRPTFDTIHLRLLALLSGIVKEPAEARERFVSDL